jgi:hypothetical protein
VQSAECDKDALATVAVGEGIRATRIRDVDLYDNQVRVVVCIYPLDMLVNDDRFVVFVEIRAERGEAKRWKE